MKKILVLLMIPLLFTLTSCKQGLDYSDFPSNTADSYAEAETSGNNRYLIYYYSTSCSHCKDVKDEILHFFQGFTELDFFILNISDAPDLTRFVDDFTGTPTVLLISNGEVAEKYAGATEVRNFIIEYSFIDFEYSLFEDQHLTTYQDVLDIDNELYILYYYLDSCPHCNAVKPDMLPWAFTKSIEDVYFMNGALVENPDNIPTELLILNSGTPILLLMSDGVFLDEYYSGKDDVLSYINTIGDGDIRQLNETE